MNLVKRTVSNYNLCPLKQNIYFCLPETTKRQLKWTSFYSLIRCSSELKLISVKSKIAFGSGEMKTNVWDLFQFTSSHIELFFRCKKSTPSKVPIKFSSQKEESFGKLRIPTFLLKSLFTGIIQILTIERCFDAHVPFQTNIHVHTLKPASTNQLTKAET